MWFSLATGDHGRGVQVDRVESWGYLLDSWSSVDITHSQVCMGIPGNCISKICESQVKFFDNAYDIIHKSFPIKSINPNVGNIDDRDKTPVIGTTELLPLTINKSLSRLSVDRTFIKGFGEMLYHPGLFGY